MEDDRIVEDLLEGMSQERIAQLMGQMAPDDAVFLISLLDEERIEPLLAELAPKQRERIEHLRTYPAESAGAMMTSQMITLREQMTIDEALAVIRAFGAYVSKHGVAPFAGYRIAWGLVAGWCFAIAGSGQMRFATGAIRQV